MTPLKRQKAESLQQKRRAFIGFSRLGVRDPVNPIPCGPAKPTELDSKRTLIHPLRTDARFRTVIHPSPSRATNFFTQSLSENRD